MAAGIGPGAFCELLHRDGDEPPGSFPDARRIYRRQGSAAGTRGHAADDRDDGGRRVLVLFNWHRWIGAGLLFGIIFPAPFFLHHFWNETDSYTRLSEFAHFIKDISLAGAALLLLNA